MTDDNAKLEVLARELEDLLRSTGRPSPDRTCPVCGGQALFRAGARADAPSRVSGSLSCRDCQRSVDVILDAPGNSWARDYDRPGDEEGEQILERIKADAEASAERRRRRMQEEGFFKRLAGRLFRRLW